MTLSIRALSPELIDDYLYFFDHIVFSENPDWSKCYCYSYHFTGVSEDWTREKNRSAVIKLISENKMKGYLAFDDKIPVGWCNANDRNNFQSLKYKELIDSQICSIVCFLISPKYRRQGIAQQLLERVINEYRLQAYDYIEAYPRKEGHSCESNYHGHLSLFKKNDFTEAEEFDDYYTVRKKL